MPLVHIMGIGVQNMVVSVNVKKDLVIANVTNVYLAILVRLELVVVVCSILFISNNFYLIFGNLFVDS